MIQSYDKKYERKIVYLFFLIWGLTFFNRLSINFVIPVIQESLDLTGTDIGIVTFLSTVAMAISAIIIGRISDKTGKRKKYLLPAVIIVGVSSMASFFVTDFVGLIIMRVFVGIGLGPILPMIFSLTEAASGKNNFGKNTGIILAGDALLANIIGPFATTQLTSIVSWQQSLFITSIPTLIVGIIGYKLIKEIASDPDAAKKILDDLPKTTEKENHKAMDIFKYKNTLTCMLLTILTLGAYFIIVIYAPVYMIEVSGVDVSTMGIIISVMGIIFVPYAIFIPRLTDKLGRKPVMIVAIIISALAPLLMFLFPYSQIGIIGYVIFGGVSGTIHVFFNTIIPMESLPNDLKTTGSSIVTSTGEILGSAGVPLIAGILADKYGYHSVMLFSAILFLISFFISFYLKETNEQK